MKKILSLIAAGAMALGLIGCSGDLHDDVKVDPNAMTGYWSYIVLEDTDTCASGKIAVITSTGDGGTQSGAFGSDPYTFDVEDKGTHAVIWDGKGGSDIVANTRTDCPSLSDIGVTLEDGEMCLFVFTTTSTCDVWAWDSEDSDVNITGGNWPGLKTTATATVPKWSFTVSKIVLNNCPAIGDAGYIAICEGWVPGNEWGATTPNKITDAANATLTLSSTYTAEAEGEADISLSLQILNPESVDPETGDGFWAVKISNGDKVTATATKAECNGKEMTLVVTFTSDNECTAAFELPSM